MSPNRSRFYFEQGLNYYGRGDHQRASEYFKEAILEDPQFNEAVYNLACCYALLGERDNALIYLSRSIKFNPHCAGWALEDGEFRDLRKDEYFQQLVHGKPKQTQENDGDAAQPEAPAADADAVPADGETVSELPPDFGEDGREPLDNLPPCLNCGGRLSVENRPKHNMTRVILFLTLGCSLTIFALVSAAGFLGIPLMLTALYQAAQSARIWVCANCGATGEDCGQPAETRGGGRMNVAPVPSAFTR